MKGLQPLPTHGDLEGAYEALSPGRSAEVSETVAALYTQWARFDPRLAELCVAFLAQHWERMNPLALRAALLVQPWPEAIGVLLEFSVKAAPREKAALFRSWRAVVTHGLSPAPWAQFFIGSRATGGKAMQDDARFASIEYRRWGYLGRDSLFNKSKIKPSLSRETRAEVLKVLLETYSRITARDYWRALGEGVSLRQAERDLAASRLVQASGNTRGRQYRKRRAPP